MHFNVRSPKSGLRRMPLLYHFFVLAVGCGQVGGDAFFEIPTLIGVDTQPSHECIWRNVPIFKINDDC